MIAKTLRPVCYIVTDLGIFAADTAESRKRVLSTMGKHGPVIYTTDEYPQAVADANARRLVEESNCYG